MKRIIQIFSILSIVLLFSINASASEAIGWYCIRTKNHTQPSLDSNLIKAEENDVIWIDKKHSSLEDADKVIYLTFDAGYENGNIEKILDVLKEEEVNGAFFILDNLIIKNKDLVKRIADDGNIIGNHTLKHRDMTKVKTKDEFGKELSALEELYKQAYGVQLSKFYRPPEGKFNEENLKWASELGYKTVMWSFAYADWDDGRQMSPENAKKKIFDNIHNGEVMLLHPTSSTNAKILKEVIQELKSQGFRFGKLDELS